MDMLLEVTVEVLCVLLLLLLMMVMNMMWMLMLLLVVCVRDRAGNVRDLLVGCVLRRTSALLLTSSLCHCVLLLRGLYPHSITRKLIEFQLNRIQIILALPYFEKID